MIDSLIVIVAVFLFLKTKDQLERKVGQNIRVLKGVTSALGEFPFSSLKKVSNTGK